MNGKTSKRLRFVTIGNHESVVNERQDRKYRWAMKRKYILDPTGALTDEKICVIVDGKRSEYQTIKEGYKNDSRPSRVKAADLRRVSKLYQTYYTGPHKILLKDEHSSIIYPIQPSGLGRGNR